ncbi:MAG: DUF1284 domain-containing protein [Firmicutes bacterium]|nr:DUF1284 domain-containing protein [Bacillota bacterium]
MSKPINLRGHHLLCIYTFAGRGYSDAFVQNMHRIVEACKSPFQAIRITERADDICACCPHLIGTTCTKAEKRVLDMDRQVLKILKITPGTVSVSQFLRSKVKEAVDRGLFCAICTECEWFASFCRSTYAVNPVE